MPQSTRLASPVATTQPNPPTTRHAWAIDGQEVSAVEVQADAPPCVVRDAVAEDMARVAREGGRHKALSARGWLTRLSVEYRDLVIAKVKCAAIEGREIMDTQEHALGLPSRDWSGRQVCDIDLTIEEMIALKNHEVELEALTAAAAPASGALSDAQLVERAVRSAHVDRPRSMRAYHVMRAFGVGSRSANGLCHRFDLDPYEEVGDEPDGEE